MLSLNWPEAAWRRKQSSSILRPDSYHRQPKCLPWLGHLTSFRLSCLCTGFGCTAVSIASWLNNNKWSLVFVLHFPPVIPRAKHMEIVNHRYVFDRAFFCDLGNFVTFPPSVKLEPWHGTCNKLMEQWRVHDLLSVAWQLEEGGLQKPPVSTNTIYISAPFVKSVNFILLNSYKYGGLPRLQSQPSIHTFVYQLLETNRRNIFSSTC